METIFSIKIRTNKNKSFADIFTQFKGKKVNLMIMDWPVKNKPYAIVAEYGKKRSN